MQPSNPPYRGAGKRAAGWRTRPAPPTRADPTGTASGPRGSAPTPGAALATKVWAARRAPAPQGAFLPRAAPACSRGSLARARGTIRARDRPREDRRCLPPWAAARRRRSQQPFQTLAQRLVSAKCPELDRSGRRTEHVGDLPERQSLVPVEMNHGALRLGQRFQRRANGTLDVRIERGIRRILDFGAGDRVLVGVLAEAQPPAQ